MQALIDAHDQIGAIWVDRGIAIEEKPPLPELEGNKDTAEGADGTTDENGDMPVETVKVVGLRKVPGQPLGLTVSMVTKDVNEFLLSIEYFP